MKITSSDFNLRKQNKMKTTVGSIFFNSNPSPRLSEMYCLMLAVFILLPHKSQINKKE